ncbi:S-adenosyl-l-methionine hydroxide adenosyltransferase family protein [Caenispirillum salinarum]|uniref:SAM hydrolase/SAM-dependent halogenase family protein n=1 Tax=Caenispirillum salinarum TaxID=859058 RepID=UPI00384ABD98
MIVLFTDFGLAGPYVGQMKAVLAREAPTVPVVDLFADAPSFDPMLSAYLLAAYAAWFPAGTVFLCVVDPGVGTDRPGVVVEAGGKRFVGPGNGLFEPVLRRAPDDTRRAWEITWEPDVLSASFHGRDIFAPIAAGVATAGTDALAGEGRLSPLSLSDVRCTDWPDDLDRIVYVDHYGNAMTGRLGYRLSTEAKLVLPGGMRVSHARTFGAVPVGQALWYVNSNGLVEIAVNQGRAASVLSLAPGTPVLVEGAGENPR